jgi:hypothetical protein
MKDVADPPLKARLIRFVQLCEPFAVEVALFEPLDLDASKSPFQDLRTLSVLADGE